MEAPIQPQLRRPRYGQLTLIVLLLLGTFAGGYFVGHGSKGAATENKPREGQILNADVVPAYLSKDVNFQDFWNVWKMAKDKYVGQPVSDVKMYYGALEGAVASLGDPYSVYFDPQVAAQFSDELAGTFEGIGAEIGIKKDQLTIIAPLPGTPAEKAGLKAGDAIVAIDGIDTTGMPVEGAVMKIRGKKGTTVKLLIMRNGLKTPKEFSITRDAIQVVSVKWDRKTVAGKNVAVITISHFNEDTADRFEKAVQEVLASNPSGIVLDLRNDPGGFLDTAIKVAGEWVSGKTVVQEKFSDGTIKQYPSDGTARFSDIPTVVLINGGSASASEIVAGALQDQGKAKLVGEKSFGKGSVQDYQQFDDGSALKITVALWLTPSGRSINKDGIKPDIEVKLTDEDYNNDRDPQMDQALVMLAPPAGKPAAAPKKP